MLYSVQREHDNLDIYLVHNTPRTAQSAMTLRGEWGLIVPITKLEAVSNVPRLCQISAICPGCGVAGGCQLLPRPAPGRVMECWVSQHCYAHSGDYREERSGGALFQDRTIVSIHHCNPAHSFNTENDFTLK